MNRRELIHRAATAVAGVAVGAGAVSGQTPTPRDTAAADPLFRPDLVQQRGVATAADNDPVVKDIEHKLKCTCGCNLDIYTCRTTDFTCTYAPELHKEVLALQSAGKDPAQVVDAFVAKYGEQVLMAPAPRGFNLAGYLVPGAAVTAATLTLAFLLLRRSRRMAEVVAVPAPETPAPAAERPEDRERLRRALERVRD